MIEPLYDPQAKRGEDNVSLCGHTGDRHKKSAP